MKKIFFYIKNYIELRNKKLSKHSFLKLSIKSLFEIFLIKILQFLKMKKLLLYLIQKFDLIYSIRIVNIENKLSLSKNWKKYNELNIDHKDNNIIKEFNKNGFYNFGKVFSNQECQNFI